MNAVFCSSTCGVPHLIPSGITLTSAKTFEASWHTGMWPKQDVANPNHSFIIVIMAVMVMVMGDWVCCSWAVSSMVLHN